MYVMNVFSRFILFGFFCFVFKLINIMFKYCVLHGPQEDEVKKASKIDYMK